MSQLMNTTDLLTITTRPYIEAVRRGDRDLQSIDYELRTNTLKVIETVRDQGPTIEPLVSLMEGSVKVSNEVLSKWKKHKRKNFTETDHTFVKDYFQYTSNILNFCSDLKIFLRAARKRHERIENLTSMWTNNMNSEDFKVILEDFKKDSEAYNVSSKNLLTKLSHFKSQQEDMMANLKRQVELQSKEKKTDGHGWWHNVFRGMYLMCHLACTLFLKIWEVVEKAAPNILTIVVVTLKEAKAGEWVGKCLEAMKESIGPSTHNAQMQNLMTVDVLVSADLQDFEILIKDMAAESDNIHENVEFATDRGNIGLAMKDMPSKLDMFLKKILEFEEKLEKCISKTNELRDEMKSTLQFKNKGSCSIM